MFNIRKIDLNKLNSLTKYPSILTYHKLGEKGRLLNNLQFTFDSSPVFVTEKIDGTNSRIIICPDGSVLVGSREDLLWEKNDLIGNNVMGILDILRPLVYNIVSKHDAITVVFGEVYGKNIGSNAKQYTGNGNLGFRLFDSFSLTNYMELLGMPIERISSWRENGGQPFATINDLLDIAGKLGVKTVPMLAKLDKLPTEIAETYQWLLNFGDTKVALDEKARLHPEGVVVRSFDRKFIAKIRHEDYLKTLNKGK